MNARRTREGNEIAFVRAWTARAPLARVIEATRLERTPELHRERGARHAAAP